MQPVSVIIPTFNRAHTLKRALDSVFNQSMPAHEVIVIDDGSTDKTHSLIKNYNAPINYMFQKNKGVSSARNAGIKIARNPWLAFLDSDDTWHPKKLALQQLALTQQEHKVAHTNEVWIRNGMRVNPMNKHKKLGGNIFQHCLPLCAISPSSVIIHRDAFNQVGLFDESLPACEDYDLWLRISAHYPITYLQQELIYKYGGHADQLSRKFWGMDRFRIQALKKIIDSNTLPTENQHAAIAMLNKKIDIYVKGALKRGKTEEAETYQHMKKIY